MEETGKAIRGKKVVYVVFEDHNDKKQEEAMDKMMERGPHVTRDFEVPKNVPPSELLRQAGIKGGLEDRASTDKSALLRDREHRRVFGRGYTPKAHVAPDGTKLTATEDSQLWLKYDSHETAPSRGRKAGRFGENAKEKARIGRGRDAWRIRNIIGQLDGMARGEVRYVHAGAAHSNTYHDLKKRLDGTDGFVVKRIYLSKLAGQSGPHSLAQWGPKEQLLRMHWFGVDRRYSKEEMDGITRDLFKQYKKYNRAVVRNTAKEMKKWEGANRARIKSGDVTIAEERRTYHKLADVEKARVLARGRAVRRPNSAIREHVPWGYGETRKKIMERRAGKK